jgi:hypothetical protein
MHYEISVLKQAIGSLAVSVAVLLGTGMTKAVLGQKGPKPEKQVVKTEQKMEGSALKTRQRGERVALQGHQRAERQAYKQSWRSRHKVGKTWKPNKWRKPHPPYDHSGRKRCVKECNEAHKNAERACKGRTGADRRACERAANEAHRRCHAGCPR